jgi:hypothetical protein
MDPRPAPLLDAMKGMPMKALLREHLAPLLALACAATVFVGAALDLPDEARTVQAPVQKAR